MPHLTLIRVAANLISLTHPLAWRVLPGLVEAASLKSNFNLH